MKLTRLLAKGAALALAASIALGSALSCAPAAIGAADEAALARAVADPATTKYGRLTGVNWFGFETGNFAPHGLWTRDYKSMLKQIADLGFNCVRLPWCNDMIGKTSTGIQVNAHGVDAYTKIVGMNVDLAGLGSLEVMDKIIAAAGQYGLKVILDNHSRKNDGYMNETLWYTEACSEDKWVADWEMLAKRYVAQKHVIGYDLNNEPHGNNGQGMKPPAAWGYDMPGYPHTDWKKAAQRCGQALLAINPAALIIVEGVEEYKGETYWWGGNLAGVRDYPITGIPADSLIYSPHEYGPEVYQQKWFTDPTFPSNMAGIWDKAFWFIYKEKIGHLFFGEFGIKEESAADSSSVPYKWLKTFMETCGKVSSWTFWAMNPNSGDTGGILKDDWVSVNQAKYGLIKPYLAGVGPVDPPPSAPTGLVASATGNTTISLDWANNSESNIANYKVYRSLSAPVALTAANLVASPVASAFADAGLAAGTTYYYAVAAVNAKGIEGSASAASAKTTGGTIPDTTPPAAVKGLAATASSSSAIALAWTANVEADLAKYRVYASTDAAFTPSSATRKGEPTAAAFSLGSLAASTTYYVYVTAVDTSGNESAVGTKVQATTPAAPVVVGKVGIEAFNSDRGASVNTLSPKIRIRNTGTADLKLADLVVKYYLTKDGSQGLAFWCDHAGGMVGGSYVSLTPAVSGAFVAYGPATGADAALVISFGASAPTLKPGDFIELQIRVAKSDWSNFTQTNDYSFNATAQAYVATDKVAAFVGGVLVAGKEP